MGTAFVFPGGDPPDPAVLRGLGGADVVIAADSGVEHALALGCAVDLVVGDLDSVEPDTLEQARAGGATVEQHPTAKDATDFELALGAARARGVDRIFVLGGAGGRLDHFLANVLALTSGSLAGVRVEARMGEADVVVVRDEAELDGAVGDLCSLLPVGGVARGVRTDAMRFRLDDEDLAPGATRGVSNELTAPRATVSVRDGVLVAVLPDARRTGR